jgi:hypothetical protein
MAKKPALRAPKRTKPRIGPAAEAPAVESSSRTLLAAVQAALQRAPDAGPGPHARKIDLVADALVAKACAGDVQAIKAVFERIDGKAGADPDIPQTITIVHSFKSSI